jgi:hypothetical protein
VDMVSPAAALLIAVLLSSGQKVVGFYLHFPGQRPAASARTWTACRRAMPGAVGAAAPSGGTGGCKASCPGAGAQNRRAPTPQEIERALGLKPSQVTPLIRAQQDPVRQGTTLLWAEV